MVTMVFITFMPLSVPAMIPALPIFAFGGSDIVVFRLWYVPRLLLNPNLGRFAIDRYLYTVDHGAAALDILSVVAWLR